MKKQISTLMLAAWTLSVSAQTNLKGDFSSVTTDVKKASKSFMEIIDIAIMLGLALALISVVYMVATKNQHAKEWVVGFVVALMVYLIFFKMLAIAA